MVRRQQPLEYARSTTASGVPKAVWIVLAVLAIILPLDLGQLYWAYVERDLFAVSMSCSLFVPAWIIVWLWWRRNVCTIVVFSDLCRAYAVASLPAVGGLVLTRVLAIGTGSLFPALPEFTANQGVTIFVGTWVCFALTGWFIGIRVTHHQGLSKRALLACEAMLIHSPFAIIAIFN